MNELTRKRFDELSKGGLLPSPKGVAMAILDATRQPECAVKDVVPLVQMDPAMAGRILRYANAAALGRQRHVASIKHAITLLGMFRVRQIALAFALIDQYRVGACSGFDYPGYWSVSLATGIAAQHLASYASSPPDESFTCGLLSGVGRLALATAFPAEYGRILSGRPDEKTLREAELTQFGIEHAALSAEMLSTWGLPDIFAAAVRCHEDPAAGQCIPGSRAFALTAALHFALRIGLLLAQDEAERWTHVPSLFNAAALAGVEQSEISGLVATVAEHWQEWAKELKLPTRPRPDLQALLASPASLSADSGSSALMILPLRVVMLIADPIQLRHYDEALARLGLNSEHAEGWDGLQSLLKKHPADVAIIDLPDVTEAAFEKLREMRRIAGPGLFCLALLPAAAEALAPGLLMAGASDYLVHGASDAALLARMTNAQRLVALQHAVRAERELVVSTADEWARTNRRLVHDALTDVLTQLPNRRYGMDRFAQEWSIASSNELPIACLMADIDHFKRVNDQHGHDVGDVVLRQMADLIARNTRRSDVAFRYGGEEFCVICPGTPLQEAVRLGERIVAAARSARFGVAGKDFSVTLSIGAAIRDGETHTIEDLISRADKMLYGAKQSGRDRVMSSTNSPGAVSPAPTFGGIKSP
jgi:two-component system cell cycle response regulator